MDLPNLIHFLNIQNFPEYAVTPQRNTWFKDIYKLRLPNKGLSNFIVRTVAQDCLFNKKPSEEDVSDFLALARQWINFYPDQKNFIINILETCLNNFDINHISKNRVSLEIQRMHTINIMRELHKSLSSRRILDCCASTGPSDRH